jgi:predicted O-methyltransferase YrrM
VLEIGCWDGGTLFLWSRVAASDALLVTVDIGGGPFGDASPLAVLCRGMAAAEQRVTTLFGRNSHAASTFAEIRGVLADRPVDFLFIDGDHSYAGVRQDFETYGALVRGGGLIALHDITPGRDPTIEVPRFWSELKRTRPVEELVAGDESFGIGLVRTGTTDVEYP